MTRVDARLGRDRADTWTASAYLILAAEAEQLRSPAVAAVPGAVGR